MRSTWRASAVPSESAHQSSICPFRTGLVTLPHCWLARRLQLVPQWRRCLALADASASTSSTAAAAKLRPLTAGYQLVDDGTTAALPMGPSFWAAPSAELGAVDIRRLLLGPGDDTIPDRFVSTALALRPVAGVSAHACMEGGRGEVARLLAFRLLMGCSWGERAMNAHMHHDRCLECL
jgi:hypothetical protein